MHQDRPDKLMAFFPQAKQQQIQQWEHSWFQAGEDVGAAVTRQPMIMAS
jgi:hypothetical protein